MPAVVGRPPPPTRPALAPRRVALAVQPELERGTIPSRVTLDSNAPPFAGELREEQTTNGRLDVLPGRFVVLATLRRPWNYIGFAVDLGDWGGGAGFIAFLRTLGRGVNGAIQQTATPLTTTGPPVAFSGFIVGATCELVVANITEAPPTAILGVRGTIWGMGER